MITRTVSVHGGQYTICENGDYKKRVEIYGLSTDEKPTNHVHNADIFYEMDTQKVFLYDESNATWLEQ